MSDEGLGFDLETHPAEELFQRRDTFMRIAGFTEGDGVSFTTDAQQLIQRLNDARFIYGHGIFTFDLLSLAYGYGADWEALTAKAMDTELLDRLDYPPMARDTGGSIDKYDLNHVAERRGTAGKTANLADIAKKHGGFGSIPLDDPDYQAYLAGDVMAIKGLIGQLTGQGNRYAQREHRVASLNGRMTLNGLRVNIPLLEERISQGEETKRFAMTLLSEDYDLPLGRFNWTGRGDDKLEEWMTFDSPFQTVEGKKWLIGMWEAFGVMNPPITDKGQLSTSAQDLRPLQESPVMHPDLRRILGLMITVTTTRTIYQTIQDNLIGDRVHPLIVMRQASGRSSVTSPGLTVMGKRGGRHVERDVIIPDEGEVLTSADLNQVDMRAVAGHAQDDAYTKLFAPGKDVHTEHAIMIYGTPDLRAEAKAIGHGANYGQSEKTLIAKGHDPTRVREFFARRNREFPRLMAWTNEIREIAASGALLDNGFGRMMRPDPRRAHTQGPALMGQGGAADIMKQCLLNLDPDLHSHMKLTVHDEVLVSHDPADYEDVKRELQRAMTWQWRGVPILCDVSKPGQSWGEISAK